MGISSKFVSMFSRCVMSSFSISMYLAAYIEQQIASIFPVLRASSASGRVLKYTLVAVGIFSATRRSFVVPV